MKSTLESLLTISTQNYAYIPPLDLEIKNDCMTRNYDPNLPVESIFLQIEDVVAYEDHGGAPLSPIQTINRAFILVLKIGIFADDCKEWKRLPDA